MRAFVEEIRWSRGYLTELEKILHDDLDLRINRKKHSSWKICSCQLSKEIRERDSLDNNHDVKNEGRFTREEFAEIFIRRKKFWSDFSSVTEESKGEIIAKRIGKLEKTIAILKADRHAAYLELDEIRKKANLSERRKIEEADKLYRPKEIVTEKKKEKKSDFEKLRDQMMTLMGMDEKQAEEWILKNRKI